MSFEFRKYLELIFSKKLTEASDYRKINMPKKLYKYISLNDNYVCIKDQLECLSNKNLNELKFNTLHNNKIWMSRFNNLNDPYEYKAMYLKRKELKERGWPIDVLDTYMDKTKAVYLISSFTKNLVDNMPMWAHYSNNHRGFCIEYNILNPKIIFPISYEEERVGIATIITQFFDLMDRLYNGKIDTNHIDYQFYISLITHFGLIKHKTWGYENEFRLLYADLDSDKKGSLISTTEVGLSASGIYVGSQCSPYNKTRLQEIAKDIAVDIYEMYLDDNNPNYSLSYRPI